MSCCQQAPPEAWVEAAQNLAFSTQFSRAIHSTCYLWLPPNYAHVEIKHREAREAGMGCSNTPTWSPHFSSLGTGEKLPKEKDTYERSSF